LKDELVRVAVAEDDKRKRIGGTDIGAIIGVNPYKQLIDVYISKLGLSTSKREMNENMEWGLRNEATVAQRYADSHPDVALLQVPALNSLDYEFMSGSPDRLVIESAVKPSLFFVNGVDVAPGEEPTVRCARGLEVKTADLFADGWDLKKSDGVPEHYYLQCLWYMILTGRRTWDLALLRGGNRYHEFVLHYSDRLAEMVLERADEFWTQHIVPQSMPALDGSDSAYKLLKCRFPMHVEPVRTSTASEEELVATFMKMRTQLKTLEQPYELVKQRLLESIGDSRSVKFDDGKKLTWSGDSTKRTERKQYKAAIEWLLAEGIIDKADFDDALAETSIEVDGQRKLTLTGFGKKPSFS